jgi:hypothetical protein
MKTRKSTVKDERARNWSLVVYPESAPDNWRDIIDSYFIQWFESPLHDRDVDHGTGEVKKEHYHVVLKFEGKKSFDQINAICDSINAPIPQRTASLVGSVRYMSHMDNPDKAQYSVSAIIGHNGADVGILLKPTSNQRYLLINDMLEFIKVHDVIEYMDFMNYARDEHFDDWFPLLCDSCSTIVKAVISSNRHRSVVRPAAVIQKEV